MAGFMKKISSHPLIDTLIHAKGNEGACLWTEPLWGIPFNLYVPFVSAYMAALGMDPLEIGITATVFTISQMIWSLLGGPLTDKFGRRLCTLIFDVLCWSVPALLWMFAQDEKWFFAAALFNGMIRVTENSWTLLFVEEAPENKLVHLYSLSSIAGMLAAFITPLSYFFVERYSLVPTMRFLYGLTFVLMTVKFVLLYFITHETAVGKRRQEECRGRSLFSHLLDSRHVLISMLKNRRIMLTVALLACFGAFRSVNDSFWSLYIIQKLGVDEKYISLFSMLRNLVLMAGFFLFTPRLNVRGFIKPVLMAFSGLAAVQAMLFFLKGGSYPLLALGVVVEALSLSVLSPLTASLQVVNVDKEERARMNGLLLAMCLFITSPAGVIAGAMSQIDRALPFVLTFVLCGASMFISVKVWNARQSEDAVSIAG